MNNPTIPMTFVYGTNSIYADTNPYNIIDGNWGGMGAQTWFRGVDKRNPKNVFELREDIDKKAKLIKRYYHRVWDNKKEIWRNLTKREKEKFVLSDRKYVNFSPKGFRKISLPKFAKSIKWPSLLCSEICEVQPMNGPTGSVWYQNRR